jgi:hypothetical protein
MEENATWNPAAPIKVHKNHRTILIPTLKKNTRGTKI